MLRTTLLSSFSLLALLASVKADETVFSTTTYDVIARIPVTEYIWTNDAGSLTTTQLTGTATYVPATDADESATITSSAEPPQQSGSFVASVGVPTTSLVDALPSDFFESSALSAAAVVAAPSESEFLSSAPPAITDAPSAIPSGDYFSTGTSSTTTTLEDGSSAVIEYVVLYTNVCSASAN